jgi:hypothetical protein
MSVAEELAAKGALVRAANDVGRTANDFGVLKFDCDTTHGANALPAAWSGRWVIMRATGGDVHFAFSKSSSAEISTAVASSAAGASDKVGDVVPDGLGYETHRKLPTWNPLTETMYFAREATVNNTILYMALGDGDP